MLPRLELAVEAHARALLALLLTPLARSCSCRREQAQRARCPSRSAPPSSCASAAHTGPFGPRSACRRACSLSSAAAARLQPGPGARHRHPALRHGSAAAPGAGPAPGPRPRPRIRQQRVQREPAVPGGAAAVAGGPAVLFGRRAALVGLEGAAARLQAALQGQAERAGGAHRRGGLRGGQRGVDRLGQAGVDVPRHLRRGGLRQHAQPGVRGRQRRHDEAHAEPAAARGAHGQAARAGIRGCDGGRGPRHPRHAGADRRRGAPRCMPFRSPAVLVPQGSSSTPSLGSLGPALRGRRSNALPLPPCPRRPTG